MQIKVEGSNFTGSRSGLNITEDINVSKERIIHAAATYGYNTNNPTVGQMIKRVVTVLEALDISTSYYTKSNSYANDESSEKRYTSYVIGMTFAKIIANEKLGFENLVFYEHFINYPLVIVNGNKSNLRPDFIGYNNTNEYLVLEAKGSSNTFIKKSFNDGKNQATSIISINNIKPLAVVTQSYFKNDTSLKDVLNVKYEDPESNEGITIKFDKNKFNEIHYAAMDKIFSDLNFKKFKYKETNLIMKSIIVPGTNFYIRYSREYINENKNNFLLSTKVNKEDNIYVGNDGVIVISRQYIQSHK